MMRPPKESVLAFQVESFELNRSQIGSQDFVRFMLDPTGTPRYVKGREADWQPKIVAHSFVTTEEAPIPKTLDLEKLTFNPEEA